MLLLIILSLFGLTVGACHPECRYACDDPVCPAICEPICEQPLCIFNETCSYSPQCSVVCPADMCESDACPACETHCNPSPIEECGSPLCEATNCYWKCRKPTEAECPKPRCELSCEQPACEYTGSASQLVGLTALLVTVLVLFI